MSEHRTKRDTTILEKLQDPRKAGLAEWSESHKPNAMWLVTKHNQKFYIQLMILLRLSCSIIVPVSHPEEV